MRRPKKSFRKPFLYLNLFFLIFVVGYFVIQRVNTYPQVLNTSVVNLTRISNYDLEYRDSDGRLKSLVPSDCQNFNYGFMSMLCRRNMAAPSTFWPSPTYSYASNGAFLIGANFGGNAISFNISNTTNFNIFREDFRRFRPILDEVSGIPVLSYYGGLFEINRSDNRAYLLTRYFNSTAYYTKGCANSKVPQNLYRIDYFDGARSLDTSVFTYGMSGLAQPDDYTYFECTQDELTAVLAGRSDKPCYKCPNHGNLLGCSREKAELLGAPELMEPSLRVRNYVTPWRDDYKCTSFDNSNFHFNMPKTHQIVVSKCKSGETCTNSGDLTVVSKNSQNFPSSSGYGFDDFRASCIGKSDNGSCNNVILTKAVNDYNPSNNQLIFSYVSKAAVIKNSNNRGFTVRNSGSFQDTNGYWNDFNSCSWDSKSGTASRNCLVGNPLISPENRNYPSFQSVFQPFVNYTFGYETPKNTTYRAIDFTRNGFVYKIPKYFNDVRENADPIIPSPNIATPTNLPSNSNISFATENYIYSINATTTNISVFRYSFRDTASSATLNFTDYYPEFRGIKDISVGISRDGTDQIDIMFSSRPSSGFNSSRLLAIGPSPSDLRVYRIHNALSTNPQKSLRIEDISARFNLTSGGQRIYPISFKRYFDDVAKRDYYVYVTSDQIYTSEVPPSSNCNLNIDRISIANTSPLSILNGIDSYDSSGFSTVDFRLGAAFACIGDPTLLPSSITLKALDPITNNQVGRIYTTRLAANKLDFSFTLDRNFQPSKKYNFELTFIIDGESYVFNTATKPNVISKGYFFSFESNLKLELYDVLPDRTSQPSYDTPVTFQKNNLTTVDITPGDYEVTVGSTNVGGSDDVYFDHNLSRVASGQIDSITNRICFGNKVIRSVSTTTQDPTQNPTDYLNTTLTNSNKCLEVVYKSNILTSYDLKPALIKVYFNSTETPQEASFSNFEINGNLFSKTDIGKVIRTFPASSRPLQGNYISSGNITSYNIKTFNNSTLNLTSYNPLPSFLEGYSTPTGNILNSTNLSQFNLIIDQSVNQNNVIMSELKGNSLNDYEIIVVSKGKGVKIDLNNINIQDTTNIFDKYIIINLDKTVSRISFIVNCDNSNYSLICTPGSTFYFKGLLVGKFDIDGRLNTGIDNNKFINISENTDLFMFLLRDIREDKKPLINTTKINLKYIN